MTFGTLNYRLTPFWALQLCGWTAFGFSMFLATAASLPVAVAALEKGIFSLQGLLFSMPLRALCRRLYRRGSRFSLVIPVCALCAYVAAMLWTACFHLTRGLLRGRGLWDSFEARGWAGLFDGGLYHAFVLFAWGALYFGIKHQRDLRAQTERTLKAELLAQQAQLTALRYQLNPHFLFNTLNAVSTLVARGENAAANRMLARLGEFLRLTLESSGAREIPLADELDFVRRYLEIEQVRLGEHLEVEYDVAPETLAAPVPNLILQPLVENAVRHGIAPREEGGRVLIAARRCAGDLLQLEVSDDGAQTPGGRPTFGSGVGLSNTRARLEQLYGAAHRFELLTAQSGGLTVQIGLPYRAGAAEGADQNAPVPRAQAAAGGRQTP